MENTSEKKIICQINELKINLKQDNFISSDKGEKEIIYGSIDIIEGDYILLTGSNGSGKSTLFKLMSLYADKPYYKIEEGKISYLEVYRTNTSPSLHGDNVFEFVGNEKIKVRDNVVVIQQEDKARSNCSIWNKLVNAYMSASKNKYKKHDYDKYIEKLQYGDELLKGRYFKHLKRIFGVDKNDDIFEQLLKKKKFKQCSGGQKKIICIVSQLLKMECIDSKLFLMDEPLNNLHKEMKIVVSNLIAEFRNAKIKQKEQAEKNNKEFIIPAVIIISHCNIFLGVNKHIDIKTDGLTVIKKCDTEQSCKIEPEKCLASGGYEIDGCLYRRSNVWDNA